MKELLRFDSMVTPKIITFVYWILLLIIALGGIISFVVGLVSLFTGNFSAGFSGMITGIIVLVVGALSARIYCEIVMVAFKINETLQKIHQKQMESSSNI